MGENNKIIEFPKRKRESEKTVETDPNRRELEAFLAAAEPLLARYHELEDRYPGAVFPAEARGTLEALADDMNRWRFKATFLWEQLEGDYRDAQDAYDEMAKKDETKAEEQWGAILDERERLVEKFGETENEVGYLADQLMKKIGEEFE